VLRRHFAAEGFGLVGLLSLVLRFESTGFLGLLSLVLLRRWAFGQLATGRVLARLLSDVRVVV
jgi:hypothetical protein